MAKKRKLKLKEIIGLILVAVIVFYGMSVIKDYRGSLGGRVVTVEIKAGSGTEDVAMALKEKGVISKPFWFRVVSKLGGHDGKYLEGVFALQQKDGYASVFKRLENPQNELIRVTFPEGFELRQIVDKLEEVGLIDREDFYKAMDSAQLDYWFLKDLPKRENWLEGYLFPDTYLIRKGETEENILKIMLNRFGQIFTEEYKKRAEELSMSVDEVVTLASVIEREAMGDVDRKTVAGVFHNRLKSDQYPYLQSCATVQYILKERKPVLSVEDTRIDSPYNTYQNPGLPLGPIASPGKASIEAALYPEETDYLFFVLDSTGVHRFAKTFAEHQENMRK